MIVGHIPGIFQQCGHCLSDTIGLLYYSNENVSLESFEVADQTKISKSFPLQTKAITFGILRNGAEPSREFLKQGI